MLDIDPIPSGNMAKRGYLVGVASLNNPALHPTGQIASISNSGPYCDFGRAYFTSACGDNSVIALIGLHGHYLAFTKNITPDKPLQTGGTSLASAGLHFGGTGDKAKCLSLSGFQV